MSDTALALLSLAGAAVLAFLALLATKRYRFSLWLTAAVAMSAGIWGVLLLLYGSDRKPVIPTAFFVDCEKSELPKVMPTSGAIYIAWLQPELPGGLGGTFGDPGTIMRWGRPGDSAGAVLRCEVTNYLAIPVFNAGLGLTRFSTQVGL